LNPINQGGKSKWVFEQKGYITIDLIKENPEMEDDVMNMVIEHGGDDMEVDDDKLHILCEVQKINNLKQKLEEVYKIDNIDIIMKPKDTVPIQKDSQLFEDINNFINELENHDEVQNVYHNAYFDEEI
jgi:transcriptional/translational regulatory protein YebC/TACO1